MKASTGRLLLYSAMKTTSEHWEQTSRVWQDQVRRDFEENCLAPLQLQVQDTLHAIDRLWVVLGQMQRDCE
jgi:hypothetical protein